jgi:hypothetical protein
MALSMFDAPAVARDLAVRVPKLGGHIATIDLQPGLGICVAKTGGPEHWSVWGPRAAGRVHHRGCGRGRPAPILMTGSDP